MLSSKLRALLKTNVYTYLYYVRSYMDECQDQMTELRKQKIDLSREKKRM